MIELARGGTSFAELAKQYCDDDGTKASGGDLGWVGKGVLVDALDDAMPAMEPATCAGRFAPSAAGWCCSWSSASRATCKPYDEIKEQLRKQLYDQQVEKAQQSWIRELRKRAHVDIRYYACARRLSPAASRARGRRGRADECGRRSGPRACRC